MGELDPPKAFRTAFDAPAHMQDPTGSIAAWFTDPPGMVFQLVRRTRFTRDMAHWIAGPAVGVIWKTHPEEMSLVFVLDLTLMDGRDVDARAILHKATEAYRHRVSRLIIVPPRAANVAYISALQVTVTLLKVFGVNVEIERSMMSVRVVCPMRPAMPTRLA